MIIKKRMSTSQYLIYLLEPNYGQYTMPFWYWLK